MILKRLKQYKTLSISPSGEGGLKKEIEVMGQSISSPLPSRARKKWAPCSLWLLKEYYSFVSYFSWSNSHYTRFCCTWRLGVQCSKKLLWKLLSHLEHLWCVVLLLAHIFCSPIKRSASERENIISLRNDKTYLLSFQCFWKIYSWMKYFIFSQIQWPSIVAGLGPWVQTLALFFI